MDQRQRQDLDNYITGHYGEDQMSNEEFCISCGESLTVNDLEETVCSNDECDNFGIPVVNDEPDYDIVGDEDARELEGEELDENEDF